MDHFLCNQVKIKLGPYKDGAIKVFAKKFEVGFSSCCFLEPHFCSGHVWQSSAVLVTHLLVLLTHV